MIVRRADLALTGETAGYASPADSGTPVRRRFCPRCGAPLLAEAPDAPDLLLPRAGALDGPERARPERTI